MSEPATPPTSRDPQPRASRGPGSDVQPDQDVAAQCPKCQAGVGHLHTDWCTLAWCATDGRQRYARCDAVHGCEHDPRLDCRTPWTGLYPGFAECRELGWYAVLSPEGWVPASRDAPGAIEDLNRLMSQAVWNPAVRRYQTSQPPKPEQ